MSDSLGTQLTRLVGREAALSELSALIWRSRLLTLCGPPGAGKTRLAVALAEAVQADFVEGAWRVDLSATVDRDSVERVIAAAVLAAAPASDLTAGAIAHRFADSSLLVLDNCEHVAGGCAEVVTELLGRAPSLRVIATSREPLGVPGEQVSRVPGLRLGDRARGAGQPASDSAAVELFLERARESAGSFDPDGAGVREAVARICRQLDGMPLSIELAAARLPVLGVADIAERLQRGTDFLRHRNRAARDHHRSLQDTFEWSHRMLAPDEQRLFRRLGAFKGSFSLAAAEIVSADGTLAPDDVLDLLSALVDRSLVEVVVGRDSPRYRLLATVRHFAARKLEEGGESGATRRRHASYFHQLARDAEPLEHERENLIEALHWLLVNSEPDAAELASLLWPFWYERGCYREARDAFEQTLATGRDMPAAVHAKALLGAGEAALVLCDYVVAADHLARALELSRQLVDRPHVATALQRLGQVSREQGRFDAARDLHAESLAIWTELGDRREIAGARNDLGIVAWLADDQRASESLCLAALDGFRNAGDLQGVVRALVILGAGALHRDQLALAGDRLNEALATARKLGFQAGIAWSLHELAILARRSRRPPRERAPLLRDALVAHSRLGDRRRVANVLEEIAGSLLLRQDPHLATEVLAYVELLREQLQTPIPPVHGPEHAEARTRLEGKLRRSSLQSAWCDGRELQLEQAVSRALHAIEQLMPTATEAHGQRATPNLTQREVAVLELIDKGQTNREIGAALYISASTAGVHVSNILRKLGVNRRVHASGLAHTLGLLPVG